jgi:hypothetical protein
MILTDAVQNLFAEQGLDRTDALSLANRVGQKIVEESKTSETPLEGVVYEVWGLYGDGKPACWLTTSGENDVLFIGKFRTKEEGTYVERRRVLSREDLHTFVD